MTSSLPTILTKNIVKYTSRYPVFGESYHWIMGTEIEIARNLMNQNETQLRTDRETAYNLQEELQQKELECKTVSDELRRITDKTNPNYKIQVNREVDLENDIKNLKNSMHQHKQKEMLTLSNLQHSIRDYHQMDNEYRERLKRISYSWSIIWIIGSVGIGTIYWWRLRKNFFMDIKTHDNVHNNQNTDINNQDVEQIIFDAMIKLEHNRDKNSANQIGNNQEIIQYFKELKQDRLLMTQQLDLIQDSLNSSNVSSRNDNNVTNKSMEYEKYIWLSAGLVLSVIAHGLLVAMNAKQAPS